MEKIKIDYGYYSDTIKAQVEACGHTVSSAERLEDAKKAINMLYISDYIEKKEHDKLIKKLHKRVMENIR